MERTTGYYNTFVVKIWRDEEIMRGHIQHASTQEHTYFLSLEDMKDFIVSHLAPPPDSSLIQGKTQGGLLFLTEELGDIGQDERMFPE